MAVEVPSFRGRDAVELADLINAYFATKDRLLYFGGDTWMNLDRGYFDVRIMVQDGEPDPIGSGLLYRALGVNAVNEDEAQAALDAYQLAHPGDIPVGDFPVTGTQRAPVGAQISHLWIFAQAAETGGLAQGREGVFAAEPVANIAAQASGLAEFYTAEGIPVGQKQIKNASVTTAWAAGERNYAIFDLTSNLIIGLPSCCGNAGTVSDSTTSPFCVR